HTLWPGELELTGEFYDTLREHAVPLDHRALAALAHSALAIDIYTWLAHRLHRVRKAEGVMLSWGNLREQFGIEYRESRDFKRAFRLALRQALAVYPEAKVEVVLGGVRLRASLPPVRQTRVLVRRK
ncbi:MAG: replication protein, partial [Alphaproteobacteria bacterium]|nr:replication protein [Alphaproteobacteria bacterium]